MHEGRETNRTPFFRYKIDFLLLVLPTNVILTSRTCPTSLPVGLISIIPCQWYSFQADSESNGWVIPCLAPKRLCFSLVSTISPSKRLQIAPCPPDSESAQSYLSDDIVFMGIGGRLCFQNFERDIVDTSWHASRNTATIRPNKPSFLLHEGKAWKSKQV